MVSKLTINLTNDLFYNNILFLFFKIAQASQVSQVSQVILYNYLILLSYI